MLEYLEGRELEEITDKRPRLKEKLEGLQEEGIRLDLWRMDGMTAGKKPLLLLARITYSSLPGKADYRLIMSQPGKNGAVSTWECPGVLPGAIPPGTTAPPPSEGKFIVIDKAELGRPRRKLTEQEKQEILSRHEAGESINKIAKALHMGTRRVMEALQEGKFLS